MTIAACYLSSEGVVLGADSTSTVFVAGRGNQPGSIHQYNFAQKVFEFGERGSTVGVVLWGLGSLGQTSYRSLIARMGDAAALGKPASLTDLADLAATLFLEEYELAFKDDLKRARALHEKGEGRTPEEEKNYQWWLEQQPLSGGLCIGGRWAGSRCPEAFEIQFGPFEEGKPPPKPLTPGTPAFWGCPNLIDRLIRGMDYEMFCRIMNSEKWTGSTNDLFDVLDEGALGQPYDLPLREAIDWIYASIYTTIKAMKFSHLAPVCGGPIEIAVISTDRPFRWVRHKRLGEAISAHEVKEDGP